MQYKFVIHSICQKTHLVSQTENCADILLRISQSDYNAFGEFSYSIEQNLILARRAYRNAFWSMKIDSTQQHNTLEILTLTGLRVVLYLHARPNVMCIWRTKYSLKFNWSMNENTLPTGWKIPKHKHTLYVSDFTFIRMFFSTII